LVQACTIQLQIIAKACPMLGRGQGQIAVSKSAVNPKLFRIIESGGSSFRVSCSPLLWSFLAQFMLLFRASLTMIAGDLSTFPAGDPHVG
jgi:hypothetical protein